MPIENSEDSVRPIWSAGAPAQAQSGAGTEHYLSALDRAVHLAARVRTTPALVHLACRGRRYHSRLEPRVWCPSARLAHHARPEFARQLPEGQRRLSAIEGRLLSYVQSDSC